MALFKGSPMAHNTSSSDAAVRKQLVEQVGGTVVGLGAGVLGLVEAGEDLERLAGDAEAEAQAVAASSEETSKVIDTVASSTEELSASLREVSQNTAQTAHAVQEAVANVARACETMTILEASSKAIGEVSGMIASVAAQTNLLALNATIEAARAGDSGRGFSVVANEVKELARQTADATSEIDRRVRALVDDAAKATQAITEVAKLIEGIGQMSSAVATAVQEQNTVTGELARSVTEGARGVEEVARSMAALTGAVAGTKVAAGRVRRLNGRLQDDAEALNGSLQAYFKGEDRPPEVLGSSTSDQLKAAVAAHGAWKARLMEVVATGSSDLDPAVVSRDDRCKFGTWVYEGSPPEARRSAHYGQVRELHAKFHNLAGQIVRQATGGQRPQAVQAVEFGGALDKLSTALVGEINSWRDELALQPRPVAGGRPAAMALA
ncbi:MAG TPA: methyl-accepting chemotaxis protein [Acidimicrobiales bacterium]|nr:methyl-accepting chemotaxis protein [Acidimicrobiales bacterium]